MEKTEQEISTDSEEIIGDIDLGGSTPASVLRVAAKLRRECPGVHFHFFSGDAMDVSERLNHGTLDFAVMLEPIDNVKYDFLSLKETSEWGVLMPKSDPLAKKKALSRAEDSEVFGHHAPAYWPAESHCPLGWDRSGASADCGHLQCSSWQSGAVCAAGNGIFPHNPGFACPSAGSRCLLPAVRSAAPNASGTGLEETCRVQPAAERFYEMLRETV